MHATTSLKPSATVTLGVCSAILVLAATVVRADEPIVGQKVYERYCAVCHGTDGKGNGPMAEVLKPTATDLTLISKWNNGDFPYGRIYEIIDGQGDLIGHGTGQMPIWGDAFERDPDNHTPYARIMELVFYLKSIQKE